MRTEPGMEEHVHEPSEGRPLEPQELEGAGRTHPWALRGVQPCPPLRDWAACPHFGARIPGVVPVPFLCPRPTPAVPVGAACSPPGSDHPRLHLSVSAPEHTGPLCSRPAGSPRPHALHPRPASAHTAPRPSLCLEPRPPQAAALCWGAAQVTACFPCFNFQHEMHQTAKAHVCILIGIYIHTEHTYMCPVCERCTAALKSHMYPCLTWWDPPASLAASRFLPGENRCPSRALASAPCPVCQWH